MEEADNRWQEPPSEIDSSTALTCNRRDMWNANAYRVNYGYKDDHCTRVQRKQLPRAASNSEIQFVIIGWNSRREFQIIASNN